MRPDPDVSMPKLQRLPLPPRVLDTLDAVTRVTMPKLKRLPLPSRVPEMVDLTLDQPEPECLQEPDSSNVTPNVTTTEPPAVRKPCICT